MDSRDQLGQGVQLSQPWQKWDMLGTVWSAGGWGPSLGDEEVWGFFYL